MTVHDFRDSLGWSQGQSDAPWWPEVYGRAFPDMVSMVDLRHDGWHQRAGRDRAIVLSSGRNLFIDEKVRREAYEDILVEVWSEYPLSGSEPYPMRIGGQAVEVRPGRGAVPGWAMKPMDCDWLAYAFVPTETCYLLPFFGLRAAMAQFLPQWIRLAGERGQGFRWVAAQNRGYQTVSIAVPTWILKGAIDEAMTVSWAVMQNAA